MERTRVFLITELPFYAALLAQCSISEDESVGTAGVRINKEGGLEMYVAPTFFNSLSEEHRVGLLMHEMLHLSMGHILRGEGLDKHVANIAMDVAINQYIPAVWLPNGGCTPESVKVEKGKSFEEYYVELIKRKNELPNQPMDNHDWEAGQGEDASEMTQEMKDSIIQKAVEAAAKSAPGNVPTPIQKALESRQAASRIVWKEKLRKFIGRNTSVDSEYTRSRANRRMGFLAAGQRRGEAPRVMIALDQSGSISDRDIQAFMSEVKDILDATQDTTEVVYFDTEIAHITRLKKYSDNLSKRWASGGTSFQCVMDYALSKRPDLLVIMTDGEAPVPTKYPRCPVFWAVVSNASCTHLKGEKVYLNDRSEA